MTLVDFDFPVGKKKRAADGMMVANPIKRNPNHQAPIQVGSLGANPLGTERDIITITIIIII